MTDLDTSRGITVLRQIDKGGMGKIFIFLDSQKKMFVLKLIERTKSNPEVSIQSFLPNIFYNRIPKIYGIVDIKNRKKNIGILMQYIHGISFQDVIDSGLLHRVHIFQDDGQIKKFMLYILNIIKDLHSLNIAHRDIKPLNIMIQYSPSGIFLVDFGLACDDRIKYEYCDGDSGTEPFHPYEEYDGIEGAKAHDIWSFGCMMYMAVSLMDLPNEFYDIIPLMNYPNKLISSVINSCFEFEYKKRINAETLIDAIENDKMIDTPEFVLNLFSHLRKKDKPKKYLYFEKILKSCNDFEIIFPLYLKEKLSVEKIYTDDWTHIKIRENNLIPLTQCYVKCNDYVFDCIVKNESLILILNKVKFL